MNKEKIWTTKDAKLASGIFARQDVDEEAREAIDEVIETVNHQRIVNQMLYQRIDNTHKLAVIALMFGVSAYIVTVLAHRKDAKK